MSIAIIIPIKNQFKIVQMCIDSVQRHYKDEEVVLVDDGSTEQQTIDMLKDYSQKNGWKLFRNENSVGHTGACQKGIDNTSSENIFLLNSDTILTERSLYLLSDIMDRNEKVAVVGPSTSSASGEQLMKDLYPKRFAMSLEEIENFAKSIEHHNAIHDIGLVNGFCFGIKRSVFNSVGGFDHTLTCYGNEKELSVRIKKAGYRTVWYQGSYVHHFGKMSYSHENINIGRAQVDADRYIAKKHGQLK